MTFNKFSGHLAFLARSLRSMSKVNLESGKTKVFDFMFVWDYRISYNEFLVSSFVYVEENLKTWLSAHLVA